MAGLLHLGSMALDILLEALDRPPPGCPPPPDDVCFRVTSWTAALLAPATTMLRFRDDLVTPAALMSAARPLKLLMTQLELSDGAPFAAALRAGAARPQLLAAALQELIGAAIYVQRLQGAYGWCCTNQVEGTCTAMPGAAAPPLSAAFPGSRPVPACPCSPSHACPPAPHPCSSCLAAQASPSNTAPAHGRTAPRP